MPTPEGFAEVAVRLNLLNLTRAAFLTYGVQTSTPTASQTASNVATAITAPGSLLSIIDSSVTLVSVTVRQGTSSGEDLIGIASPGVPGGRSLISPPPNVAVLVHKGTARGGRRGRGRFFIPWCVAETDVEETGQVAPAARTTINTAMSAWLAAGNTQLVPMHLMHGEGNTPQGAPNQVESLLVDPLISTQRRRLGRGG